METKPLHVALSERNQFLTAETVRRALKNGCTSFLTAYAIELASEGQISVNSFRRKKKKLWGEQAWNNPAGKILAQCLFASGMGTVEYLKKNRLSHRELVHELGSKGRPSQGMIVKLIKATNGRIDANLFFPRVAQAQAPTESSSLNS